jgi:hypothetical protein
LKQGKALSYSENAPVQEIRDGKHKSIMVSSYFSDSVSSLDHGISEKVATSTMDYSQGIISHLGMPPRSLPSLNYLFQSLSFLGKNMGWALEEYLSFHGMLTHHILSSPLAPL